jgi:hypothetical protein
LEDVCSTHSRAATPTHRQLTGLEARFHPNLVVTHYPFDGLEWRRVKEKVQVQNCQRSGWDSDRMRKDDRLVGSCWIVSCYQLGLYDFMTLALW